MNKEIMEKVNAFVTDNDIITIRDVSKNANISIFLARKYLDELTMAGKLKRTTKKTEEREYFIYSKTHDKEGHIDDNGFWVDR